MTPLACATLKGYKFQSCKIKWKKIFTSFFYSICGFYLSICFMSIFSILLGISDLYFFSSDPGFQQSLKSRWDRNVLGQMANEYNSFSSCCSQFYLSFALLLTTAWTLWFHRIKVKVPTEKLSQIQLWTFPFTILNSLPSNPMKAWLSVAHLVDEETKGLKS